jgi:hypothetical protein
MRFRHLPQADTYRRKAAIIICLYQKPPSAGRLTEPRYGVLAPLPPFDDMGALCETSEKRQHRVCAVLPLLLFYDFRLLIVGLLAWSASQSSVFAHVSDTPSSPTGRGASLPLTTYDCKRRKAPCYPYG